MKILEIFNYQTLDSTWLPGQYYWYIQYRPNGRPFYVGKGRNQRYKELGCRNKHYLNIVKKYGRKNIRTVMFPVETEALALQYEVEQIYAFRCEGVKIVNITNGGDGISNVTVHNKGVPMTPGQKQILSRTRKAQEAARSVEERIERNKYISTCMLVRLSKDKDLIYTLERNQKVSEGLKNRTPEEKADAGRKGWETRRRNKQLKKDID